MSLPLTNVHAGKLPPGIRCEHCKGTLSDIRSDGVRYWVHCYSCHFQYYINPRRPTRPIRTEEEEGNDERCLYPGPEEAGGVLPSIEEAGPDVYDL